MAKKKSEGIYFLEQDVFYTQLWNFYVGNRRRIRANYNGLTKKILAYNDPEIQQGKQFLRRPQFEALEMYVFIKEFMQNAQVSEMFNDWRKRQNKFSEESMYFDTKYKGNAQENLFWDSETDERYGKLFELMESFKESYPNYIYALTMGLGKTILMATCIFYEFLLANKYPKDKRFCHNVLVFAPDKTVLQSLREIQSFDKSKVVPAEYVDVLDGMLKFHYLDSNGAILSTLDDSSYNVVVSNTQKIIVKQKHRENSATENLFKPGSILAGLTDDFDYDATVLTENQRFQKLCRLPQLGVYVDEAHHLFGANLFEQLYSKEDKKTCLRSTINRLAEKTSIVACYNFTGTPYVEKQVLPEVVYSYGLKASIANNFLKDAAPVGFEHVHGYDFLKTAVTDFWKKYSGRTYEGLTPKLAIFAATIEEAIKGIRPAVEEIIAELGISTDKILVNVGDERYTKDEDIRYFNELDVPESLGNEKQFIILVGKGREGWNCRSLMSVAMFRSPKSKVFVLQATMRCLRQITDEQLQATVYLSNENLEILNEELEKNFNMRVEDLGKRQNNKQIFKIHVLPPVRRVKLNSIQHNYKLVEKEDNPPVNIELSEEQIEKYTAKVTTYGTITDSLTDGTVRDITDGINKTRYSELTLVAEIARYLNMSCLNVSELLRNSKNGIDDILKIVNEYNDSLYDVVIPEIFSSLYEVKSEIVKSEKEAVLLKEPDTPDGCYEFSGAPELVVRKVVRELNEALKAKSFHADVYCFDSKPELKLFYDYLKSNEVKELYFTGMFTSAKQTDFAVQYYDTESQRIRSYYPDFYAIMADGSCRIIEVKGDNMIDNSVVLAKQKAAEELASVCGATYKIYKSSDIMSKNVLALEREKKLNI